ncbi:MAG TPA: XVIPCD domain-containing protein [Pseudoxanthomonas sp.]|nr:XVIPCD domain-containing protein [Pseudoxanthomonas sp.]
MRDDSDLPQQDVKTRQEKAEQIRQQRILVTGLRTQAAASGDAGLDTMADALQRQYHAADHSRLQEDVYLSAAHRPASAGLGYFRASEHLDMLNKLGVPWTQQDLKKYLQPDDSDFRAEIYLPDPAVYGADAKPVVVFKGSNGPVVAQDGSGRSYTRESALGDWIENARQGLGLESDHYNRAMRLGVEFQRQFSDSFELSGHSKGGGHALAAAAVTGMPAYTSNAATLHPETARRYAHQNGLQAYDIDALAHGYHVKGEVLHDGINMAQGMNGLRQTQLGGVVRQLGELAQLPGGKRQLESFLKQSLPHDPGMQEAALGLVSELATRANRDTLRDLPLHAGPERLVELAPKSRGPGGEPVDRPWRPDLYVAEAANAPLLNAVSMTTTLAVAGKRGGEVVVAGAKLAEQGASAVGEAGRSGWQITGSVANAGTRQAGEVIGATVRFQGEVVAGARLAAGHVDALKERTLGKAEQWSNSLTSSLMRQAARIGPLRGLQDIADWQDQRSAEYVQQRQAAAARAIDGAKQDAAGIEHTAERAAGGIKRASSAVGGQIESHARQVGDGTAHAARTAGATVRVATEDAPTLGAYTGLTAGVAINARNTVPLTAGALLGKIAAGEAVMRHGMKEVVQPSMDARTTEMEQAALERMQQLRARDHERPAPGAGDGKTSMLIDDPRHPAFPLYQDAERGVHREDARVGRQPDIHSRQIAGSLAAEMHVAGGSRIDYVILSRDASTLFGLQGRLDDPGCLRVCVNTVAAINTPLSESTQRAALADMQRTHAMNAEQQQEQVRATGPRLG